MSPQALTSPEKVEVNRSELRRRQSAVFRRARGRTVVAITNARSGRVKYLLDERYLEELWRNLRAAVETLEILKDRKLLERLLRASGTLDQDVERGRLRPLEEVFGTN